MVRIFAIGCSNRQRVCEFRTPNRHTEAKLMSQRQLWLLLHLALGVFAFCSISDPGRENLCMAFYFVDFGTFVHVLGIFSGLLDEELVAEYHFVSNLTLKKYRSPSIRNGWSGTSDNSPSIVRAQREILVAKVCGWPLKL
jgi:hypothetical protein